MTIFFVTAAAVLGLLLGSFLNALAYRLPRKESLMTRSHCTVCFKQITAWENVPLFSWLLLRGRCSGCKTPISPRYPLIEAFTAVIFGAFTYVAFSAFGDQALWGAIVLLSFAFVGVLLALIDLDTFKLPSKVIYSGFIVALIGAVGYTIASGDPSRGWSAVLFMAIYLALYALLRFIKPKGIGLGDVRLAPLIGFVLGFLSLGSAVVGFFAAWVLAFLWLLPGLISGKVNKKNKIPFGPWMILGAFVAIIFGDILFSGYLQLGGL